MGDLKTLDEWAIELKRRLKRFVKAWKKKNQEDPESWPMEDVFEGDWDEHFDTLGGRGEQEWE